MAQSIQIQHAEAFSRVSAFVVLRNGVAVATIAFKYPEMSAGHLHAYVHWFGATMTRGAATGYYMTSEAVADAARKIRIHSDSLGLLFVDSLGKEDGYRWRDRLKLAGFQVIQAV